jgi:hypothetical protein
MNVTTQLGRLRNAFDRDAWKYIVVRDKPAFRIKNRFLARNTWGICTVEERRAAIVNARMAAVDAENRIPRR